MTTLALSPILAASLATSGRPVASRPTTTAAPVSRVTSLGARRVLPELREPDPEATAVPAPATPAPRPPAPRVVAAAPPAVPPADPNSIIGIIQAAAARWGVSGDWMVKIARCESGLNPRAYNPRGPYIGLFQFLESTFRGNGGTNIYDPVDQANITAKMLAHGQAYQWSCA